MHQLSFVNIAGVIGSAASVVAVFVGIAALEWPAIKALVRRRMRPDARPVARGAPLSRSSILAATSAAVGAICLSMLLAVSRHTPPTGAKADSPTPAPAVAGATIKPDAATTKLAGLDPVKVPRPDESAEPGGEPKPDISKDIKPPLIRKAPTPRISEARVASTVPDYSWNVPWETYPDAFWLQSAKSDAAREASVAGSATMTCLLADGGRMWTGCKVVSETPEGYGFGDTALKYMRATTLKPDAEFEARVGKRPFTLTLTIPLNAR